MKRVRLTYEQAYHHGMNRGTNGEDIFCGHKHKAQFLDFLEESLQKYKLRLFAYCIMDNHYHLVLENSSLKLSDFFRHLNGQYGLVNFRYWEINKIPPLECYRQSPMAKLYRDAKLRLKRKS